MTPRKSLLSETALADVGSFRSGENKLREPLHSAGDFCIVCGNLPYVRRHLHPFRVPPVSSGCGLSSKRLMQSLLCLFSREGESVTSGESANRKRNSPESACSLSWRRLLRVLAPSSNYHHVCGTPQAERRARHLPTILSSSQQLFWFCVRLPGGVPHVVFLLAWGVGLLGMGAGLPLIKMSRGDSIYLLFVCDVCLAGQTCAPLREANGRATSVFWSLKRVCQFRVGRPRCYRTITAILRVTDCVAPRRWLGFNQGRRQLSLFAFCTIFRSRVDQA